jgi:hypothetical protein
MVEHMKTQASHASVPHSVKRQSAQASESCWVSSARSCAVEIAA